MVKYTGRRGSQITKNSTNQQGLKLSGSGGGIGSRFRNVGQRVTDNVKVCGPVYRHGVIWSINTKKNSICLPPAPKCQSIAGGVGRINAPRFSCSTSKCPPEPEPVAAVNNLQEELQLKADQGGGLVTLNKSTNAESPLIIPGGVTLLITNGAVLTVIATPDTII